MNSLYEFLDQGGPVMYALLALSVLALAILLLKLVQFARLGLRRTGFVQETLEHLKEDGSEAALRRLATVRHPAARVMECAVTASEDPAMDGAAVDAEIVRVGSGEVRDMESWLRALASIAHLSPFLGLLGTVLGMIAAFMQIEAHGSKVDAAQFSGGIWEALLTTAFGLAIAIPTMAAYFYLEGEVDGSKSVMKDASTRVMIQFQRQRTDSRVHPGPVLVPRPAPPAKEKSHGI